MSKNPLDALPGNLGNSLGDYLREQRVTKKLSVRQLSALAGVSNPYLSQIERGVKRPSADILQQIAKGLSISAETLYVQAGLLDPKDAAAQAGATTRAAIGTDPALTSRQRQTILDIYESFVGGATATKGTAEPARPTPRSRAARKAAKETGGAAETTAPTKTAPATAAKKTTAKKTAATKKSSSTTPGSKTTTATRAARGTTPSSRTSTSRRNT